MAAQASGEALWRHWRGREAEVAAAAAGERRRGEVARGGAGVVRRLLWVVTLGLKSFWPLRPNCLLRGAKTELGAGNKRNRGYLIPAILPRPLTRATLPKIRDRPTAGDPAVPGLPPVCAVLQKSPSIFC